MCNSTLRISLVLYAVIFSLLIAGVNAQPLVTTNSNPHTNSVAVHFEVFGGAIKQGAIVSPPGTPANPCDYQGRTSSFGLIADGVGAVDSRGMAKGPFEAYVIIQMQDFDYVDNICQPASPPGNVIFEGVVSGTWSASVDPELNPTGVLNVQFWGKVPNVHGLMTTKISNPLTIPGLNGYLVVENKAWIVGSPNDFFTVEITST